MIIARNDWLGPDRRSLRRPAGADLRQRRESRWIDFLIAITATNGPVTFGDTKEGTFGMRVAESMRVEAKHGGRIVNSRGQTDAAAWGKPAEWVDYHGPVDGQTLGIAILNHPASFRFPTGWHVRTYGLFAANPFAQEEFPRQGRVGRRVIRWRPARPCRSTTACCCTGATRKRARWPRPTPRMPKSEGPRGSRVGYASA